MVVEDPYMRGHIKAAWAGVNAPAEAGYLSPSSSAAAVTTVQYSPSRLASDMA